MSLFVLCVVGNFTYIFNNRGSLLDNDISLPQYQSCFCVSSAFPLPPIVSDDLITHFSILFKGYAIIVEGRWNSCYLLYTYAAYCLLVESNETKQKYKKWNIHDEIRQLLSIQTNKTDIKPYNSKFLKAFIVYSVIFYIWVDEQVVIYIHHTFSDWDESESAFSLIFKYSWIHSTFLKPEVLLFI